VVSGGAKGVDAAAMQTCGEAGGIVIGVLAADLLRASVNRQNRQGLQSGQLVLISPFNPEAGFNAGNAMARNRYIYALADYAVVVDSAEGEGGTWAGAIEDLRHEWTPLYVREAADKPGNLALIKKGANRFVYQFETRNSINEFLALKDHSVAPEVPLWFPSQSPADGRELSSDHLFHINEPRVAYVRDSDNAADISAASVLVAEESLDMFPVFLQRLSVLIETTPRTVKEIGEALGLETSQLRVWLAAAVSAGFVSKLAKPVAYVLSKQKSLC
jgi:predicted Rossmann fold nucleotide-binding protein DprA/Smf involved in DNA uptake